MKHTKRILSVLLALCLCVSMCSAVVQVSAAEITTALSVSALADGSSAIASELKSAITSGSKDSNGVYYGFGLPKTVSLGSATIGTPEYTLMAAQAICALSEGKSSSTEIAYQDISFHAENVTGGSGTTLTKGQYLDLAARVADFGSTMSYLPHSFNRPSDGSATYDGRISAYALPYIFAQVLASYASDSALPSGITFLPTHIDANTTEADETTESTEPSSESTEPSSESTEATTASTEAESGITLTVIASEGKQLVDFIKNNLVTPNYSTLDSGDVAYPAEMMYLLCQAIGDANSGSLSKTYTIPEMDEAANPQGSVTAGTIAQSEYVTLAKNVITFMDNNGAAPNYCTCSLGTIDFEAALYFYASIMGYYYENKTLPASVSVKGWDDLIASLGGSTGSGSSGNATFGADYSAYSKYLVPTTNCQSNNATIISVAKTGMAYTGSSRCYSSPSNTYQAMVNLFEYLNDKTSYSYYENTSKGALGTWNAKTGNCCDMAHLMNACARSLGVPGRYRHGNCTFQSGLRTGHVWSEVYCGSSYGWKTADLVSDYNYLGYKTSTTNYYSSADLTATLPF
ncbi:MAG: transglutaminase domain-containing protein [Faecousia sp.]